MTLFVVLAVLFACLALGVPVYASLIIAGMVGVVMLDGFDIAINVLGSAPFRVISSEALIVVPLFILMGTLVYRSGATDDLFVVARRVTRRLPGGLGMATVLTGGGVASVTGSSIAAAALMARVSLGELIRAGYDRRFASGMVAAVGTLGVLIPPSIMLVVYGIAAQESIRSLLLAGLLPGLVTVLVYLVTIYVSQARKVRAVPLGPAAVPRPAVTRPRRGSGGGGTATAVTSTSADPAPAPAAPESPTVRHWLSVGMIAVTFLVVIGGLYRGWFTSVEAAAIGTLCTFLILLIRAGGSVRRVAERSWQAIREALDVSGMIFLIVIGASIFGYYLTSSAVPAELVSAVTGLDSIAPIVIVVLLTLMLLPLGMFLDGITILLISVPLMHPVVTALGYDGIWFGIIMVKLVEIGLITPPVGLNAFVVAGSYPSVKTEDVFLGIRPFLIAELVTVAILFLFPGIVTWLPSQMV